MYKVSKFTFCCLNSNHELLLYNTFEGTRSFCKFQNDKLWDVFHEKKHLELNQQVFEKLITKGIIVDEAADEDKKLLYKIIDTVKSDKLILFINPTQECNFRCRYCYESFSYGKMSSYIQEKIVRYVRENIHKYSGLYVSWFGGEPLLAMDCIKYLSEQFIKICNFNKRRFEASITTNGYLLSVATFCDLLKYHINHYQVTLDGSEEIHDAYRVTAGGNKSFARIVNNLKDIKALKRGDFLITIRSNFTLESYKKIEDFLAILEEFCYNDTRFNVSVFKAGNWLQMAQKEILEQLIEDKEIMRKIYTSILNSPRKINLSTLFLEPGSGVCYAGKLNNYLICSDGSIHKCTVNFEDAQTAVGILEKGKITHNNNFYSMLSDFRYCKKINSCVNAPICMGNPCPLKIKSDQSCSYFSELLDIIMQIFDKQNEFELLG